MKNVAPDFVTLRIMVDNRHSLKIYLSFITTFEFFIGFKPRGFLIAILESFSMQQIERLCPKPQKGATLGVEGIDMIQHPEIFTVGNQTLFQEHRDKVHISCTG